MANKSVEEWEPSLCYSQEDSTLVLLQPPSFHDEGPLLLGSCITQVEAIMHLSESMLVLCIVFVCNSIYANIYTHMQWGVPLLVMN